MIIKWLDNIVGLGILLGCMWLPLWFGHRFLGLSWRALIISFVLAVVLAGGILIWEIFTPGTVTKYE